MSEEVVNPRPVDPKAARALALRRTEAAAERYQRQAVAQLRAIYLGMVNVIAANPGKLTPEDAAVALKGRGGAYARKVKALRDALELLEPGAAPQTSIDLEDKNGELAVKRKGP
jgi:hypothetical protein